ncbi:hypothetical protein TNIN_407191 [Trichonephila inaurata madagascariensis]|uniref:Uncharacterized protein n=1 Tax=Trichonephila inaurata madagascariensis TaxID=2747483 RepID=A0A8X7CMW0_9ARAC|nr:hypothetical protein TNIN_407191 [Trichonephila inaurata madagascariensis]
MVWHITPTGKQEVSLTQHLKEKKIVWHEVRGERGEISRNSNATCQTRAARTSPWFVSRIRNEPTVGGGFNIKPGWRYALGFYRLCGGCGRVAPARTIRALVQSKSPGINLVASRESYL